MEMGPALYLTDDEIAARVGVGVEKWRANANALEAEGMPKRDVMFCGRRYWPAVRAFLDRRAGLDAPSSSVVPDGEEDWSHAKTKQRPRTKAPAAN